MANDGVKKFQEKRTLIVIDLITEACRLLINKKENITALKIKEKIVKIAKKRKIENKYLVDEQSIMRNSKYKLIVDTFKKEQTKKTIAPKNIEEMNQFNLRDKFDMITQDYLELLDEKKLFEKLYLDNKLEIQRLEKLFKTKNINHNENKMDLEKSIEIIGIINVLLEKGPLIINKNEKNVIIKSYSQKEDDRFEFTEKEWKTL
ncbi:hypothetical protein [Poseidonibacter ostreae]|uniref:Uncharacterized protein n=1 Tax=Poseidonibacter ostreae TaxID=2654171 RepID=A0ABQ6VQ59_9BACT|nr:hypothetical protein [Poseidonibacter ostreae]KAB7891531.1 hypothetical protein GBG18_06620 [Poseidonibacter ostreae]